jgi:uncharacterized protein
VSRGIPNDFIAEYVARYPGRAVGFAAVDPTDEGAAHEFERSVTTLGLRGLKLSPVYHGYDPWSPAVWRLYEMADAFRVPVMFHMGARTTRTRRSSGAAPCCWTGSAGPSPACA